jgi:hypothetical protein
MGVSPLQASVTTTAARTADWKSDLMGLLAGITDRRRKTYQKEQTLPGIPSAKEVSDEGVSLGQMQATLLAKIEELTLHVIRQEKEIQRLKQQLNGQSPVAP